MEKYNSIRQQIYKEVHNDKSRLLEAAEADLVSYALRVTELETVISKLHRRCAEFTELGYAYLGDPDMVYWYLDEGGFFGKPRQVISPTPLVAEVDDDGDVDDNDMVYYFRGYVPRITVRKYSFIFNKAFPETPIELLP